MVSNDMMPRHEMERLRRRIALARVALLWERLWPALWPILGVAGVFATVVLLDVLPALPGWLHLAALLAFAAAVVWALRRGFESFRAPSDEAARRRLEANAGLTHRPLTVLADQPAIGSNDTGARALWRAHLARAARAIASARVGWPHPRLAAHDPQALRIALVLALVVSVFIAGNTAGARLNRAMTPDLAGLSSATPASLEMWITPPEYTGIAPIFYAAEAAPSAPTTVPSGSTILAQVHDGRGQPELSLGEETHPLTAANDRSWRVQVPVTANEPKVQEMVVRQGNTELAMLTLSLVPDRPPTVAFVHPPAPTRRAALRVEHRASDDFGVREVVARIARPTAEATEADADLAIELLLPGAADGEPVASFHDLTAHPWAGLPVEIVLEATDAVDQVGRSDSLAFTLPEREFTHPVAREIIAQRKQLTRDPDDRVGVARALTGIGARPERYGDDFSVHLALNVARSRLLHGRSDETVAEVQQLLWDTALRVEDGGLSLAERELRELQRRLQEALANNADDAELEQLLEELRAALDRFFQAARENLQRQLERGEVGQLRQLDPEALALRQQDLERLIDQARDLSRMGARDQAREMLSQLQEMLESLSNQPMFALQPPEQRQAEQLLDQLQDITRGQQQLLDRTFRESQEGQQPPDGGRASTAEQESLRRQLGEAMRQLGEMTGDIPQQLGNAEQSMRESTQALSQGEPGQAVGPQGEALDQLREGARAAAQRLAEQIGQGEGPGQGEPGQFGEFRDGQDPLGRQVEGTRGLDTGRVAIPEEADLQRARQILDELRRRAGERDRPAIEQEYIRRLLRRF